MTGCWVEVTPQAQQWTFLVLSEDPKVTMTAFMKHDLHKTNPNDDDDTLSLIKAKHVNPRFPACVWGRVTEGGLSARKVAPRRTGAIPDL